MPAWLIEGNLYVYFVLGCACAALFWVWWRTRKPRYAVAAVVMAALIVGVVLMDHFFESDAEQMVRKVGEIVDAVNQNDVDRAFLNVSNQFDHGGTNKDRFYQFCKATRESHRVTTVKIWDKEAIEVSPQSKSGAVAFRFKVAGSWGETPGNHYAKVMFTQDPDGQWRVKDFEVFDTLNQSKTPMAIPGLGAR